MAVIAFLDHRDRRSILWPSIAAVLLVGFQAWLGRETVRLGNTGESVTAHLAAAMALVGLLVYLLVRASYPARVRSRPGAGPASQRFTLLAAFAAAATFVLLLFGSNVTAQQRGARVPGLAADERRHPGDRRRMRRARRRLALRRPTRCTATQRQSSS